MSIYKRTESFRFTFNPHEKISIKLKKLDDAEVVTIDAELVDISKKGARILSHVIISEAEFSNQLYVNFKLHEKEFSLPGEITWRKPSHEGVVMGVELKISNLESDEIFSELKIRRSRDVKGSYNIKLRKLQ